MIGVFIISVEKVCTILQFVDSKQVSKQLMIQSSLALCSVFVINSLSDCCENVATRALIGLKSVRRAAMKVTFDAATSVAPNGWKLGQRYFSVHV